MTDPRDQPDTPAPSDLLDVRGREAGRTLRTLAAARLDPFPTLARGPSRGPARRGRWAVASLTAALIVAAIVIGPTVRVPIVDDAPVTGPGDVEDPVAVDGELPVPPVGEALPAYLADGTPVFVSHPEDGEVVVVGAVDGHGTELASKLVVYCRTSRWFEEPRHGTRYNAWGDYTGGPSPTGLDDHVTEVLADGQRVRVTGEVTSQRPRDDLRAEQPQRGPNCVGEVPGDVDGPQVVRHRPPSAPPTLDGDDVPADRWTWAQVTVGGTTHAPVVCSADGSCRADGTPVRRPYPAQQPNGVVEPTTITALVRRTADGVRLLLAADDGPIPVGAPGLLPVPPAGEASATSLDVGRPVFVTRTRDGDVHVLDASSTHFETDLIAACPTVGSSAGVLFDWAEARWDLAGGYLGGPGVGDLRAFPTEVSTVSGATVVQVTGDLGPVRGRNETGPRTDGRGPCAADELVRHVPPEHRWVVGELPRDTDGWFWVEARAVEVDGQPMLCAAVGCDETARPILTESARLIDEPRPVVVGIERGRAGVEVREPVPADGTSNPGTIER